MIVLEIELNDNFDCIVRDVDTPIFRDTFTLIDFRQDNYHEFKYGTRVLEIKTYDNGEDLHVCLLIDGVLIDSDSVNDPEVV